MKAIGNEEIKVLERDGTEEKCLVVVAAALTQSLA